MTPRRPPWWARSWLSLNDVDCHHAGGFLVLAAGLLGGLLTAAMGLGPPWAGFFAGALPMFALVALAYFRSD